MFNPFPGLRPFEPGEDHLFFGREKQVDELLRRLRVNRFLAIVGTSGSGKSSLVRSGLIPALDGGLMAQTSSVWRIAIMRPGEDPVRYLAAALNAPGILGQADEFAATNRVLLEATLKRGSRGLVEAVRQARIADGDNLLLVVDQFEELFRFRRNAQIANSRDEAISFVKLLLEATAQEELPIYVVLTMRSDFIGDCMDYAGLPEAVNSGQYLVPRMTRSELRSAIMGPVAVGGSRMTQRLVLRLLNDFGDDYDQLPILQHALMRTWDHWENTPQREEAIDVQDYEAIGTVKHALSIHAEEAYEETGSEAAKKTTERLFRSLTDTFSDPRGTRRPTSLIELTVICTASREEIVRIVEIFRRTGRSFLMPPANVELEDSCMIDLSHESLMRCWTRLVGWTDQERTSAEVYARLSDAATWFRHGRSGLWRNPELEFAQKWKIENQPTSAWSRRYNPCFEQVMEFLDRSEAEWQESNAKKKWGQRRKLRQTQQLAAIFGFLFVVSLLLAFYAWRQTRRAQSNLQLAKQAVDESLSSAGREQAREGSDLPQLEQFRKELLDKAASFYTIFAGQNTRDFALRLEEARAHARLGDINRLIGDTAEATRQYADAVARFGKLAEENPKTSEFRRSLAYCHNWLGETIRQGIGATAGTSRSAAEHAEKEYSEAIRLQADLHHEDTSNAAYQQELARTYYNRGIIRFAMKNEEDARSDFSEAISLLETLILRRDMQANDESNPDPAQDLARVYNDDAILISYLHQSDEAVGRYEKAVAMSEQLIRKDASNREYKAELAQYCDNEARLLVHLGQQALAAARSQRGLEVLNELAEPAPSLSIKRAQALQLRGQLLEDEKPDQAKALTDDAFSTLKQAETSSRGNCRCSVLYMNIEANYLELAEGFLDKGKFSEARESLANIADLVSHLPEGSKTPLEAQYDRLQNELLKQRAHP